MRDTMKEEKIRFLNVTFNIKRNPAYKGSHELAQNNRMGGCTYPLGTTKAEMIAEFHAEFVGKDINGKSYTKGDIIQVESVDKCFEDSCPKGRFHKDNY